MRDLTSATAIVLAVASIGICGVITTRNELLQEKTLELIEKENEIKEQYKEIIKKLQSQIIDQKKLRQQLWLCERNR